MFFHGHEVYKQLVRKKHRLFKNILLENLKENEKKNLKDFWNTVNNLLKNNKSDPSRDVSPDTWIQHFKSLLNMEYTDKFLKIDNSLAWSILFSLSCLHFSRRVKEIY